MSPAQTVFAAATVKWRASRFEAIGRAWLLSVVHTRKRRLPRPLRPFCRIVRSTRRLPTRTPRAFSCRHTRGHPYAPRASAYTARISTSNAVSLRWRRIRIFFRRAWCWRYPDALTPRTRHCTHTGQSSLFFSIQAYFIAAPSRSTPSLFPEYPAPSSLAPAPPADGCSPSAPRSPAHGSPRATGPPSPPSPSWPASVPRCPAPSPPPTPSALRTPDQPPPACTPTYTDAASPSPSLSPPRDYNSSLRVTFS